MTEAEKILLNTLKNIEKDRQRAENDREDYDKNVMASLVKLAERVGQLEKLTEQLDLLTEQNRVLTEQLQRFTTSPKQ
ncbi:MAG: hypothetical protein AB7C92_07855 [Synergistaceae bacterium]